MTRMAILISAMPEQQAGCLTALRFCQAAIAEDQKLSSIFFYGSAVLIAQPIHSNNANEPCVRFAWQQWAQAQQLRLALCSAAVTRFGITTPSVVFNVSGLGQWLGSLQSADRLIQFR